MIEMEYKTIEGVELLDSGCIMGYDYYIINFRGNHPNAYIRIPENNPNYMGDFYDSDKIEVHGGITYESQGLDIGDKEDVKGHIIGWDYAHSGDYIYFDYTDDCSGKKWKVCEILHEVVDVCKQLINLENEENINKKAIELCDDLFEHLDDKMSENLANKYRHAYKLIKNKYKIGDTNEYK